METLFQCRGKPVDVHRTYCPIHCSTTYIASSWSTTYTALHTTETPALDLSIVQQLRHVSLLSRPTTPSRQFLPNAPNRPHNLFRLNATETKHQHHPHPLKQQGFLITSRTSTPEMLLPLVDLWSCLSCLRLTRQTL